MILRKTCWTLVCLLLAVLLFSTFCTATADNIHELRAVTPATTELTISDPNVKSHYVEMPNYCYPTGEEYGTVLAIGMEDIYN